MPPSLIIQRVDHPAGSGPVTYLSDGQRTVFELDQAQCTAELADALAEALRLVAARVRYGVGPN